MEPDLGTREEIARSAENEIYGKFIRNLIFLPTAREIRQAVTNTPDLHPPTLDCLIAHLADQWRQEGRTAEAQLLDYVKTLINPFLPGPAAEVPAITTTQSLMAFLLRAPNALRMQRALTTHRTLVNRDLLEAARDELLEHEKSPPTKQLCLAMYLIARAIDDRKEMVTGLLMWGAFCRRHHAMLHAERHFQRASELAKGIDAPETRLGVIGAQAGLYRAMNRYQEACATLEEGLKFAEVEEGGQPLVVSFADGLSSCYRALGQTAKALDAVNRMIAVADRYPGKKSRALNFRGQLNEDLGRYEIGKMDYDEAAQVAAAEGDRLQEFIAMTNAAASLLKREMSREGYHAFQDVLLKVEAWGNPLMVASTHNNLGHALRKMGNFAAARAEYSKALATKMNSHDSIGEATAFLGIGHCEAGLGNPDTAHTCFVLALIPALETRDVELIGQVELAIVDRTEHDDDLEKHLQSLRWVRDLTRDQAQSLLEAVLVTRIAALLKKAGRIDEAIAECRALLQSRSSESELTGLLMISAEYARLLGSRAESWPEAFALLLERVKVAEQQMDETLINARLGEIAGAARPAYEALLELLSSPFARSIESRSPQAFGFDLHESAKARSLLAHLADEAALAPSADVPAELRQMESALLGEERKWQEERVPSERLRYEKLGQIREALKDCWEHMRQFAPDYVRTRSNEPYTLEEIHDTLRATTTGNTALVSFFVGTNTTACFVVRADRDEPIMLSIPLHEEDLKQTVRQLQRTFNGDPDEFPPYPPIRGDMPFRRKLDFLDGLSAAMSPLFACLEGIELICVAPHGPLHTVPLHALRHPDGQYLAEKYAIVYTPSLSVALNKVRRSTAVAAFGGSKRLALVAGVSSADDTHPQHFEVDAALFDAEFWELHTAMGVQSANRDAILSGLHGKQVIHVSCHAYFDARNPQRSGLVLTNGQAKAPRDLSRLSVLERQSYVVTVRDLMHVSLDAELVTLSACSTGLQRDRNAGDEFEGFARALLRTGARSALLAMWNVDQSSSHKLLSKFYHNWSVLGQPKWKALQAAQRELIGDGGNFGHPYHWAPFSLIGSWR